MSPNAGIEDQDAPLSRDELSGVFRDAEKPESEFRIGGEGEKFGVDRDSGAPVAYEGPRGIRRVFDALIRDHGWEPYQETEGGPVIALLRDKASITLEPAAQLELSGAPLDSVHELDDEMRAHVREIEPVSREMNVVWLGLGYQPFAGLGELPWVPKQRYRVMKTYLPARGARGLDMMQRTATVQANFDYSSEADAMRKLVVLLKVSPLLNCMTANSPFSEGRLSGRRSERGSVWLEMDPARSGLIPSLWAAARPSYEHYVEWALDAGMFLFRRGDTFIANTGQTFRSFLADGYHGHHATMADWVNHLNSLFPEARLKRTIEARSCDSLPLDLASSIPALVTGVLYDPVALEQAEALMQDLSHDVVEASRRDLVTRGLRADLAGRPVLPLVERLLSIAEGGLARRNRVRSDGRDERVHLDGLRALVTSGKCPADVLVEGFQAGETLPFREVIRRAHL